MTAEIFNGNEMAATNVMTAIIAAGLALAWAAWKRRDGITERAEAKGWWEKAIAVQAANDKARWAPAYSENLFAIEPADKPHDAEVLHVAYPTQELRLVVDDPQVAAGLAVLADEVGLVQAVGCCDSHDICNDGEPCNPVEHALPCCTDCPAWTHMLSDRPAADEDEVGDEQPGEAWFARLKDGFDDMARGVTDAINWPIKLAQQVAAAWRRRRDERYLIGSGEQAVDPGKPLREVLAASGYELDIADEAELQVELEAWKAANPPTNPQPYTGRHWVSDVQHTSAWPLVIPKPRDGEVA